MKKYKKMLVFVQDSAVPESLVISGINKKIPANVQGFIDVIKVLPENSGKKFIDFITQSVLSKEDFLPVVISSGTLYNPNNDLDHINISNAVNILKKVHPELIYCISSTFSSESKSDHIDHYFHKDFPRAENMAKNIMFLYEKYIIK